MCDSNFHPILPWVIDMSCPQEAVQYEGAGGGVCTDEYCVPKEAIRLNHSMTESIPGRGSADQVHNM